MTFYFSLSDIAVGFASEDVAQNTTVITVPLDFTKKQREAVKKCAISAGFNVTQVISEVAAATLAYDISQENQDLPEQKCLIFQCGGATLTCSVVSVSGGMVSVVNSLKKDIGGDQITEILIGMQHIIYLLFMIFQLSYLYKLQSKTDLCITRKFEVTGTGIYKDLYVKNSEGLLQACQNTGIAGSSEWYQSYPK